MVIMTVFHVMCRISVRAVIVAALAATGLVTPMTAASADPTPSPATAAADAQQVLILLNAERHAHGLAALKWNTHLLSAAHGHNLRMANANVLSHQLPGEQPLGTRLTAAGYHWRAAAENCGVTTDWSLAGIEAVQRAMYNEVAPNDGHRRAILSTTYHDIGIDIVMDAAHHKAWITEDFGAAL
jgi:uncharacterized protein YkwD